MPKPPAHAARLEGSRWTPYLFVAPVAVYLLLFQGYPLLQEMMLGFTSTSLLSPADHTFVGVRNYVELIGTATLGYLIFGNFPDAWTWLGAMIIIASGLYIALRERRRRSAAR